jgi:anthranilate synthase/aminodeoxychorismate synthase-like glutamine amidotransferase
VRVVFIENHDSFSLNVLDVLPFDRHTVNVVEGNTEHTRAALEGAELLIIGPGPMDPLRAGLVSLVEEAAACALPTLGICLGHQAIGLAFGARLIRTEPTHGKKARAHFRHTARFLEGDFEVMRYHSLSLDTVEAPLRTVASLADQTVMAIEHETLPMAGLQFHPDSHGTPEGRAMVEAFVQSVRR